MKSVARMCAVSITPCRLRRGEGAQGTGSFAAASIHDFRTRTPPFDARINLAIYAGIAAVLAFGVA